MLELFFLFYWLPKKMTQLARERNRSAVGWSVLAIGAWIGAEVGVFAAAGILIGMGSVLWGWDEEPSTGTQALIYLLALGTAILSVTVVIRILRAKPRHNVFPAPPPPPKFSD
ncbi:MAG TPA: hypothetical protein VFX97_10705 [Pyrinomonadaceae bacterium]|nr:hypothetical protein [Pyrinomonadaceae bacterium]